jgi:hypothetical protein
MRLLDSGLADALIITPNSAGGHICQLNSDKIYYASLSELQIQMFHYVNPKHQHLLEPLNRIFATEEIQGLLLKIKDLWIDAAHKCGKQLIKLEK